MADTTVKYFTSSMSGAPTLNNAAGSLIAVLNACLVNGFGSITSSSVVIASGVCTITFATAHGWAVNSVIKVSGVTTSGYASLNAEQKVTAVTTYTASFATTLADAKLTEAVVVAIPPAGWTNAFSGTNIAAYKSVSSAATGLYFRVDDTTTTYASVRGYEAMTDISTGTGIFPLASQIATSSWYKDVSGSAAHAWAVFANARTFYIVLAPNTGYPTCGLAMGFGDFSSTSNITDAYGCFIAGQNDASPGISNGCNTIGAISPQYGFNYAARSYTASGSSVVLTEKWLGPNTLSGQSGYNYPNGPNNSVYPTTIYLVEGNNIRGSLPGAYAVPQSSGASIADGTQLVIGGNTLVYKILTNAYGGIFFDVGGPWSY